METPFTLRSFSLLFLLFPLISHANPDAKRLYDDLMSSYNSLVLPVANNTDILTVKMSLKLSQLIDVVSISRLVMPISKHHC